MFLGVPGSVRWDNIKVESSDARLPEFKFPSHYILARYCQTSCFTTQCLGFLICKMRVKSLYFIELL